MVSKRTLSSSNTKNSKKNPLKVKTRPPFPKRKLKSPGLEKDLSPRPEYLAVDYKSAGKLQGKKALITGGDSGIGRAVAVIYAREGADVAINYLPSEEEEEDAQETRRAVESFGQKCHLFPGDLSKSEFCRELIEESVQAMGGLDILVSNAAYQARKQDITEISTEEWEHTFKTNVEPYFLLVKNAIPHLKPGSCVIATSSETSVFGNQALLDYSATKGAIDAFTRSLARQLIEKGIRVNAVAPGPVWTPLNPADPGQEAKKVAEFGSQTPIGRPAQPDEIAPSYVFLASNADSLYITGVVIPLFGGEAVQ